MSTHDVLLEFARTSAVAAGEALRAVVGEDVEVSDPRVCEAGSDPFRGAPVPGLAAVVAQADGVSGGSVLVVPVDGARRLARALRGGSGPAHAATDDGAPGAGRSDPGTDAPLDDLERSALAEVMNQMMAAAAGATGAVLGADVRISPPAVRDVATPEDASALADSAPHATVVSIAVGGAPCRLVQLVPYAFVVRMTRALDERDGEVLGEALPRRDADPRHPHAGHRVGERPEGLATALGGAEVDLWVELGRTRLPAGRLAGVPDGEVLALDRLADDPVDLFVNGLRVGTGRLLVVEGSEWAVRIETLVGDPGEGGP